MTHKCDNTVQNKRYMHDMWWLKGYNYCNIAKWRRVWRNWQFVPYARKSSRIHRLSRVITCSVNVNVNKLVKNGIIKCPNCSIFCPVDDVKPDFRLATFLDALDETVEFKTKPIRSSANIDDVTQQHVTPPPAKPKYKCWAWRSKASYSSETLVDLVSLVIFSWSFSLWFRAVKLHNI